MPRINRRSRRREPVSHGLSPSQEFELLFGVSLGSEQAFATPQAYEQAWRIHKAALSAKLAQLAPLPFHRAAAYWELEAKYVPDCKAANYEGERQALLRFKLPLTAEEEAILIAEKAGGGIA